jgi:hypothetical protein
VLHDESLPNVTDVMQILAFTAVHCTESPMAPTWLGR